LKNRDVCASIATMTNINFQSILIILSCIQSTSSDLLWQLSNNLTLIEPRSHMCSTLIYSSTTSSEVLYSFGGSYDNTAIKINGGWKLTVNDHKWYNLTKLYDTFEYSFRCHSQTSTFQNPKNNFIYITGIYKTSSLFGDIFVVNPSNDTIVPTSIVNITLTIKQRGGCGLCNSNGSEFYFVGYVQKKRTVCQF